MKVSKTDRIPAGAVDDSINAPMTTASSIINMRWNGDTSGWINDRALQPWWQFPSTFTWNDGAPDISGEILLGSKVDSVYFWKKPTGEIYTFIEQGGTLYVQYGNKGQGTAYAGSYFFNDIVVIATDRQIRTSQFIPYGNRLLILNGFDAPIWFNNPLDFRGFGCSLPTPSIDVISINADYPQDQLLTTGTGAPYFDTDSIYGLGDTTGKRNNYYWKMTYVLDSGAESPLSASENINWVVPQDATYDEYKFGAVMQLPIAPKGTVARRLYRTKNCLNNEESYYFLKEFSENASTFYIDVIGDIYLVTPAPTTTAAALIATDYQTGENWDGRIWLAKDKKIIYSEQGIPEQFGALSFFDLGNTIGGNITALKAYYNNLIVFRENAINIIRFSQSGYSLATVSSSVGTTSPNAITIVPKFGLTFVNDEGVWSMGGGLDGGSTIQIRKISISIDGEWQTINRAALSSIISSYSPEEKELWIHYPYGYETTPTRGVVLHVEREGIAWSLRKAVTKADDLLFNFSAMTTDLTGRFVFGSVPNWSTTWNTLNATNNLFGALHVWCASHYHSQTAQLTSKVDNVYVYTVSKLAKIKAEWASNWFEWQNGMVRVYSVEVELIAKGDTKAAVDYTKDYQLDITATAGQKQTDSGVVFTTKEPPVTVDSTTSYGSITKNPFVVNSSRIHNQRKVVLRFDCRTELCNNFKFTFRPDIRESIELLSFKIDHKAQEVPKLNQSTRLQKGQPR